VSLDLLIYFPVPQMPAVQLMFAAIPTNCLERGATATSMGAHNDVLARARKVMAAPRILKS